MTLPQYQRNNYETLLRAAKEGALALLECTDAKTGKMVPTLVAVEYHADRKDCYNMVPIARMFTGNPYDEVLPPT